MIMGPRCAAEGRRGQGVGGRALMRPAPRSEEQDNGCREGSKSVTLEGL